MRNRFELLKKKKNSIENPKLCIKYQEKSLSEKKKQINFLLLLQLQAQGII